MKKFKFLPTILMICLCIGILAIGVFAIDAGRNDLNGSITVSGVSAPVKMEIFIDSTENGAIKTISEVRGGEQINFDELLGKNNLLKFDAANANEFHEVPARKIIVRVTNLNTEKQLGAYFLTDELSKTSRINILDDICDQNGTKVADAYLPSYAILNPNNALLTAPLATQDLEIEFRMATWEKLTGKFNYHLYIEEYDVNAQTEYEKTTSSVILQPIEESAVATSSIKSTFVRTTLNKTDIERANVSFVETPNAVVVEGVEKIAYETFKGKTYLNNIAFPTTLAEIEDDPADEMGAFCDCVNLADATLPKNIKNVGAGAFLYCSSLTNMVLPHGLANIGWAAFCDIGATEITIPGTVQLLSGNAFGGCDNLEIVTIKNGVQEIGPHAFANCQKLKQVHMPQSVKSADRWIFRDCSALEEITIPVCGFGENAENPEDYFFGNLFSTTSFEGSTSITQACYQYDQGGYYESDIASKTFYIPTSLKKVNFIGKVAEAGAFSGMCNFEFTIGKDIEEIKDDAFCCYGCGLQNMTFTLDLSNCTKLTSIGHRAFYDLAMGLNDKYGEFNVNLSGCTSLSYLGSDIWGTSLIDTLDLSGCTNLNNIHEHAFDDTGINEVYFPSLKQWCELEGAKPMNYYSEAIWIDGVNIKEATTLNIPDGTKKITDSAFVNFSNLVSVTIPNSVTKIGSYAFLDCMDLETVIIPNSVTYIGISAFSGCSSLEKITLPFVGGWDLEDAYNSNFGLIFGASSYSLNASHVPESLEEVVLTNCTTIPDNAFRNCPNIQSITIPAMVTYIGANALTDCTGITDVTVPFAGDGTGNITHFGYLFGCDEPNVQHEVVPESLKNVNVTNCTTIGSQAFYSLWNITNITFPENLEHIGDEAFEYCYALTDIVLPNSLKTADFGECGVRSITIPSGVKLRIRTEYIQKVYATTIEDWIAYNRGVGLANDDGYELYLNGELLTEVQIPEGTEKIEDYAFSGIKNLTSVSIPSSVKEIGDSAFYRCSGLTSVTITNGVEKIGYDVFKNCTNLTKIEIPSSVSRLENDTLDGCNKLTEVSLPFVGGYNYQGEYESHFGYIFGASSYSQNASKVPSTLKKVTITGGSTIGDNAFKDCASITSLTLPNTVSSIGTNALTGCTNLAELSIPFVGDGTGTHTYLSYLFGGTVYNDNTSSVGKIPSALKTIVLTSGTTVPAYAFYGCSVSSITMPNTIKTIEQYAFWNIYSVKSITIPNGVTTIGNYAFKAANGLTSITIPESVTSIGTEAFLNCYKLEEINYNATNVTSTFNDNSHVFYLAGQNSTTGTVINIGENVTQIPAYLFHYRYANGFSYITGVNFKGNECTTIGEQAFGGCYAVNRITIPSSITSIGEGAFDRCNNLRYVYNNSSIAMTAGGASTSNGSIAAYAGVVYDKDGNVSSSLILRNGVYYNTRARATTARLAIGLADINATSLTLDAECRQIIEYAFRGCKKLVTADLSAATSVTTIGTNTFFDCTKLTTVTLPPNLTSTSEFMFQGCVKLNNITLPSTLTKIATQTFHSCTSLTSITIPSGVKTIEYGAFYNCQGLTSITIPASVTTLGANNQTDVFYNCRNLASITILAGTSLTSATKLTALSQTNKTFKGWYTNSAGTGTAVTQIATGTYSANTTYYAVWA